MSFEVQCSQCTCSRTPLPLLDAQNELLDEAIYSVSEQHKQISS